MKHIRHLIFLKDVLILSLTSFGGAQAHLAMFYKILVQKRAYLTEAELLELNSFCQILPGPASTQTVTAVAYKMGGTRLALLTLLIWLLPATIVMTAAAIAVSYLQTENISLDIIKYLGPIAIGFVFYAAYKTLLIIQRTKTSFIILILTAILCFFLTQPWIFPIILLIAGFVTSFRFGKHPKVEKTPFKVKWLNLFIYGGIFVAAAVIGKITNVLPIRLFENFFRNGSLIFGGGQALIGYFFNEFVEFKKYLTASEFLTGYAVLQSLPGPVFSFASYIGALSMRAYGFWGEIAGGFIGSIGVFLPGTILIFFIAPIWKNIKEYRVVKASFEGINAGNAGIIFATAFILAWPLQHGEIYQVALNDVIIAATMGILIFTRIPHPFIIIAGLLAGWLI
ncbi:chromate transporter [uncultured Cytophaga sp.]|uniref:chromate transporter n=1 Tax=uncultured Cytophaga sp. TaxID=160238 RepID=UPI00261A59CA|nr:chromate transporter [uncultured Cytophaga sp.]